MPNKNKPNKLENSNKLENFSENYLNKKLNNNHLSYNTYSIYSSIIINLIVIIWCSFIINYLSKIDLCDCYNDENKSNYANIKYLIIIEYLFIITSIIMIVSSTLKSTNNNKKINGLSDNPFMFFFNLLSIIIFIYFVYYVYKFSENVNINCSCTQNWVRYLLYIQSFFLLFVIFGNLIMLFS